MVGEAVPALVADRVVPVRHGEELLGLLVVTKPPSEPVTPVEDAMLGHVASQAGLVLRNVRLVDDLRSSRERLVTTQATNAAASSATCTTAPSRAWCRWRCCCGWLPGTTIRPDSRPR